MLERLYTTKMSADKKTLENRLSKICSKSTWIHRAFAALMAVAVMITVLCANLVMAMVDNQETEQFKIEVKHGDVVLQLNHRPFVQDNTVYLPLRELFEKIGFMDNEYSFIQWDNGRIYVCATESVGDPDAVGDGSEIKYLSWYFSIEIGKAEYTWNPPEIMQRPYRHEFGPHETEHVPILKDGITYIPFEFIEYLVNRTMQTPDVTCSVWDLAYDDNTDRKADYINDSISIEYASSYEDFQYDVKGFEAKTLEEVSNAVTDETAVQFWEHGKRIEKRGNWYEVGSEVFAGVAFQPTPKSVTAYYTPAGTETEELKTEVGRTDTLFEQNPTSIELNLPEGAFGHVHFVLNYGDYEITSAYYNVIMSGGE